MYIHVHAIYVHVCAVYLAGEEYLDDGPCLVETLSIGVQSLQCLLRREQLLQLPQDILPHLED